jgi:urea transport system permease protein
MLLQDKPPALSKVSRLARMARSRRVEMGLVGIIAVAVLFILPPLLIAIGQGFRIGLMGRYMALAIAALGIDLIWGYGGILSLGHGLFFALGGYALAMYLQLQVPGQLPDFFPLYGVTELPGIWQPFNSLPFTLFAIVALPTIIAGVLGYLVFRNRLKGVYFSILTQAALIVFFNFFNGQQKIINGTNGLKTDTTMLLGRVVGSPEVQGMFYSLTAIALVAAYALCRYLTTGRLGKMLVAVRDDESRLRFSGYDPTGFKVLIFAVSAGLAGIAGALFTVQSGIITPKAMDIAFSIEMVIWVAVGGRASLVGAIIGAIGVNFAKSFLSESFPQVWLFFQGALFLLVVTVLPGGIVGWVKTEGKEVVRWVLRQRGLSTYPSLVEDGDYERQQLEPDKTEQ